MGPPAHKPGTSPALHFPISAWVTHASHPSMRSNRLSPDQVVQSLKEAEETQNAYVESFQGKLRDECLNGHLFLNLADARPDARRVADDLQSGAAVTVRSVTSPRRSLRRRIVDESKSQEAVSSWATKLWGESG